MGAPLVRETGGADFQVLEPAVYDAVCTWIVGVGPQVTPWGVKEKLKFRFEIPSVRIEWTDKDGNEKEGPAITWATWTASLSEKAELRKVLEGWRGRKFTADELAGFSLDAVLGAPCTLVIVNEEGKNGRIYDRIDSITRLQKGHAKPEPEGDLIGFDVRNFTQAEYDALPEWCQRMIDDGLKEIELAEDLERVKAESAKQATDGFADDDIPF